MTRLRLLFAIPLAAIAFAGCGGDDAPSKEDFAADAEKICADLEKQGYDTKEKFRDLQKRLRAGNRPASFADLARKCLRA